MAKKRGKEKSKGSNPKSGLIPRYKKIQKMDFTYEKFARLDLWPITSGITGDGQHLTDNVKGLLFCNHFGYACWEQDGSVLLTDLPDKPTNKSLSDKEWIRWINRDNEEAKFNQLLDAAFRSRNLKNFGSIERPEVKPFEFLAWLAQKGYPLPGCLIEKWDQGDHDELAQELRQFHKNMMYLIEHGKTPPGILKRKPAEKKKIKKPGRPPHPRIEQVKKAAIALKKKNPKMTIEEMTHHRKIIDAATVPNERRLHKNSQSTCEISQRTLRRHISAALKSKNSS